MGRGHQNSTERKPPAAAALVYVHFEAFSKEPSCDELTFFRVHRTFSEELDQSWHIAERLRVYHSNPDIVTLVFKVAGDKLVHLGQCLGKITHSGKFRLSIGCLDLLASQARYKVISHCTLELEYENPHRMWTTLHAQRQC